jgi:hypothetical protein
VALAVILTFAAVLGEGPVFAAPFAPPPLKVEQSVPGGPVTALPRAADPAMALPCRATRALRHCPPR